MPVLLNSNRKKIGLNCKNFILSFMMILSFSTFFSQSEIKQFRTGIQNINDGFHLLGIGLGLKL